MTILVDLVSPEKLVYSGEASMIVARTPEGEIGFLTDHVPFVGVLVPGEVRLMLADGSTQVIAVHSGFVQLADNHLTVLSDTAELAEEIDIDRARASLAAAEEALRADADDEDAASARMRADIRLRAAGAN